jgi:predicted PurR-regulated permease PerM
LATIALVILAGLGVELVLALRRIFGLVAIAAFFAIMLNPAVDGLHRRGVRRGLSTLIVFLLGLAAASGLAYLFLHPIYTGVQHLSRDLPDIIKRTEEGKGTIGKLLKQHHLDKWAKKQIPRVQKTLSHLGGPALKVAKRIVSGAAGLVTVMVLTFLMLLEAPDMTRSALALMPPERAARVQRIARDAARSVTGYVLGNTATSLIAGMVCYVTLRLLGVPFAGVFGVWVALVDLLPLVGGLLAGVPTVAIAFIHSPRAGIVTLIVFIVYQQVENHILNPVIMSRTVRINPLWVILSVLVGAELAGIAGALLAIPIAGAIQVVVRDVWDERTVRLTAALAVEANERTGDVATENGSAPRANASDIGASGSNGGNVAAAGQPTPSEATPEPPTSGEHAPDEHPADEHPADEHSPEKHMPEKHAPGESPAQA